MHFVMITPTYINIIIRYFRHTHVITSRKFQLKQTYTYINTHIHTHTYIYTDTYIYIHIYIYTHTQIHIYT